MFEDMSEVNRTFKVWFNIQGVTTVMLHCTVILNSTQLMLFILSIFDSDLWNEWIILSILFMSSRWCGDLVDCPVHFMAACTWSVLAVWDCAGPNDSWCSALVCWGSGGVPPNCRRTVGFVRRPTCVFVGLYLVCGYEEDLWPSGLFGFTCLAAGWPEFCYTCQEGPCSQETSLESLLCRH